MADALSAMIDAASNAGHFKGVVSHLVQGGVTHLQYADNTILLMELDDNSLINLKFILIAFEIRSGLKINFLKTEVIVMGAPQEVQARVANALNCKQGSFPFTYLGFPIAVDNSPYLIGKVWWVRLGIESIRGKLGSCLRLLD
jgi:hypothetical protein